MSNKSEHMILDTTVNNSLLLYSSIHKNSLDVYKHLFCTIGNGYDWIDGQLVDVCENKKYMSKHLSMKEATRILVKRSKQNNLSGLDLVKAKYKLQTKDEDKILVNTVKETVDFAIDNLSNAILLNFDIQKRIKDFEPYDVFGSKYPDLTMKVYKKILKPEEIEQKRIWKILMLSPTYSYLCNFPDDIKGDWLVGIDKMAWFIATHPDNIDYTYVSKDNVDLVLKMAEIRIREVVDKNKKDGWQTATKEYPIDSLINWKCRNPKTSYISFLDKHD